MEAEKKYKLDLSEYQITVQVRKEGQKELVDETIDYPIRKNFSGWLRTVGMFRNAEDVAEAVCLAKQIRDTKEDFLILDEKEARVLKMVVDKHLELAADNQMQFPLGGEVHEEAIVRVANMEEIKAE
jgi:hypothetical protein